MFLNARVTKHSVLKQRKVQTSLTVGFQGKKWPINIKTKINTIKNILRLWNQIKPHTESWCMVQIQKLHTLQNVYIYHTFFQMQTCSMFLSYKQWCLDAGKWVNSWNMSQTPLNVRCREEWGCVKLCLSEQHTHAEVMKGGSKVKDCPTSLVQ